MAIITYDEAPPEINTPPPPVASQTLQTPVSNPNPNPEMPESSHHPALRNMGMVDSIRITQIKDATTTLSLQMNELWQYMQLIATHVVPQATLLTPTLGGNPVNNNPAPPPTDNLPRTRV